MTAVTGKTVYILGAGASFHTGAPLLRDFLVTARFLLNSKPDLVYKDKFENVFKWIDGLRAAAYYINLDLDNMEHLFSIAEMKRQLGHPDGEEIFSDLRYVIMETLDDSRVEWKGEYYKPDDIYYNFVESLINLNIEREKIVVQRPFEKDVVITFNYDVMLDYAFKVCMEIDYGLEATQNQTDKFKVLKLHGSTNWGKCNECSKKDGGVRLQIVDPVPTAGRGIMLQSQKKKDGTKWPFRMVTHVMKNTQCQRCKQNLLEPEIIPPTWSKYIKGSPLPAVWANAVKEIEGASQIVIIGYSMPLTDTFFQYLLTLGLSANPNLHRVVVANWDNSQELVERYESKFSKSMKERHRLRFLPHREIQKEIRGLGGGTHMVEVVRESGKGGATFESFVKHDMMEIGSQL
ncbi:MAG TPA: hypothetical protein VM658_09295 [bacterium]|nr:hypothetical protein [bacterium]